ncbi:MAG: hypothetical protein V3W41_08850 [Planctomycetota bacterium]
MSTVDSKRPTSKKQSQDQTQSQVANNGQSNREVLDELRRLIAGDQVDRLERVEHALNDPKEDLLRVSRVLPDAILLRGKQDSKLSRAMAPNIEDVIKESVHKRPQVLADALFPVMGPAIRRSISDTLATFLQSINQTLEHSFSPKSLGWRFEAWRTGRPFSEIVLSHTILYRVEQVFLIHNETGLLLQHVAASAVNVQDGDMVSGMLTAIQDFVKDSFGVSDERESLRSMRVADLTVWIESGPVAALALVMRGTPAETLRDDMKVALEEVHLQEGDALSSFDGDAAPFDAAAGVLETLLVERGKTDEVGAKGKKRKIPWLALSLVAAVLAGLAVWGLVSFDRSRRWSIFNERVASEPGFLISGQERKDGKFFLRGLKDPRAADAKAIFADVGLDPDLLVLELATYESRESQFVIARAADRLAPPAGVSLELKGETLFATGLSDRAWAEKASRIGPVLTGITEFDASGLRMIGAEARKSFALFVKYLKQTPGIVVVEAMEYPDRDGKFLVRGFRDPLSASTDDLRAEAGLQRDHVDLSFSPVLSLDPVILLLRAKSVLQPPPGVTLKVEGQKLIIEGRAPAEWVSDLETSIGRIAGIEVVDQRGLVIAALTTPSEDMNLSTAWMRFADALKREPGVKLEDGQMFRGRPLFRGRKDPLARSFLEIGASVGVSSDRARMEFEPYLSQHPDIVLRRAQVELELPTGVLPSRSAGIKGLDSVNAEGLFDDAVAELQRRLEKAGHLTVSFDAASVARFQPKLVK